jgi:hypothetical protein
MRARWIAGLPAFRSVSPENGLLVLVREIYYERNENDHFNGSYTAGRSMA